MTSASPPGGSARTVPRRLAALAGMHLLAFAVVASRLSAQPSRSAFDYRSELRPGHESTVLTRGDFNGDGVPDLLVAGPGHITVFEQGGSSFDWKPVRGISSSRVPIAAAAGRLNADGRDDLVLLCGPRPSVAEIYLSSQAGVPILAATIDLPGDFLQVLLADPDADRDVDLLFFGKKTTGVTVYTGNGRGAFASGPVLMPDVPVGQAAVAPMDGDNIPDLVIADWLGDNIQVYPGFGGLNFGDPAVLPFDEEPISLAVGDMNGDRVRDIVAGFGERRAFTVYAGDGLGHFTESAAGPVAAPPEKIRIGDLDGDSRNDLLMFLPSAKAMAIGLQGDSGAFSPRQTYSAGDSPTDVVFFQDARRRGLNAAVLSSANDVVRLLHARSAESPDPAGVVLATGVSPAEIGIADLNDDGWPDIVLAQGAESSLSLFMNDGRGTLGGQVNVAMPFAATGLKPVATAPGDKDFLATAGDGASIAYLSVDPAAMTASAMTLRTEGGTVAIDGRRLPGDHPARRVYATRQGGGTAGTAVFTYELAGRARYDEAEVPLDVPGRIVSLDGFNLDADGRTDLAVLSEADTSVWVSFFRQSDDGFEAVRRARVPFPDTVPAAGVTLWASDLNGDGNPDLVMNFARPAGGLAVSIAEGPATFSPVAFVLTDVRVPTGRSLSVTDFDGDGNADLVFVNERTRTVQFLPGNGRGGFDRPVNLTGARGVRGFNVGDLNRDGEKELILSDSEQGVLTVTSFHHPLFVRKRPPRSE